MKIYLLQAAMGFGILLLDIAKALLFAGIPILTIILSLVAINRKKEAELSASNVIKVVGRNFLYSIISLILVTVVVLAILMLTVDLSDT